MTAAKIVPIVMDDRDFDTPRRQDTSIPRWGVYPVGAKWAAGQVHPTYGAYTASERIFDTFREAAQYRDDQLVPGPKSGMLIPAPEPQPSWDDMSWRERIDSIQPGLIATTWLVAAITILGSIAMVVAAFANGVLR